MIIVVHLSIALAVTLIAVQIRIGARRNVRLTSPAVLVNSGDVETHPSVIGDPDDAGIRAAHIVVASPAPLVVLSTAYTVQFHGDPEPAVDRRSLADAKAALLTNGVPHTAFCITNFSLGATLVSSREHLVFAIRMATARRLKRLTQN